MGMYPQRENYAVVHKGQGGKRSIPFLFRICPKIPISPGKVSHGEIRRVRWIGKYRTG
jgi:hypothetical protein